MKKRSRLMYIIMAILIIWCVVLTIVVANNSTSIQNNVINENNVSGFSTDLTKVVENKKGSIVSIATTNGASTGFVYKQIEKDIYILTSYHGVANETNITIYFSSGYKENAKLVDKNIYADLAVLKLSSEYSVEPLNFADVSLLNSGEFVISIGTPTSLEYAGSVELGMIASDIRTIENSITVDDNKINYALDVIQLSNSLKPGYSGSPVLNMEGEVIGMTTMSLDENNNFAICSNEIKIIADKLIAGETDRKYQIGIKGTYLENMPSFEKSNYNIPVDVINGLYVNKVYDNSIASLAGIKQGDLITSINDVEIKKINDYLNVSYSDATEFSFKVLRNNTNFECKAEIND